MTEEQLGQILVVLEEMRNDFLSQVKATDPKAKPLTFTEYWAANAQRVQGADNRHVFLLKFLLCKKWLENNKVMESDHQYAKLGRFLMHNSDVIYSSLISDDEKKMGPLSLLQEDTVLNLMLDGFMTVKQFLRLNNTQALLLVAERYSHNTWLHVDELLRNREIVMEEYLGASDDVLFNIFYNIVNLGRIFGSERGLHKEVIKADIQQLQILSEQEQLQELLSKDPLWKSEYFKLDIPHVYGLSNAELCKLIASGGMSVEQYRALDPNIAHALRYRNPGKLLLDGVSDYAGLQARIKEVFDLSSGRARMLEQHIKYATKATMTGRPAMLTAPAPIRLLSQMTAEVYRSITDKQAESLQNANIIQEISFQQKKEKNKTFIFEDYLRISDEGIDRLITEPGLLNNLGHKIDAGKSYVNSYPRDVHGIRTNKKSKAAQNVPMNVNGWMENFQYERLGSESKELLQTEAVQKCISDLRIKAKDYVDMRLFAIKALRDDAGIRDLISSKRISMAQYTKMSAELVDGLRNHGIQQMIRDRLINGEQYRLMNRVDKRMPLLKTPLLQQAIISGKITANQFFRSPHIFNENVIKFISVDNIVSMAEFERFTSPAIAGLAYPEIREYLETYPELVEWYGSLESAPLVASLIDMARVREMLAPIDGDDRADLREEYRDLRWLPELGRRSLTPAVCTLIAAGRIRPVSLLSYVSAQQVTAINANFDALMAGDLTIAEVLGDGLNNLFVFGNAVPQALNPYTDPQSTHAASVNESTYKSFAALLRLYGDDPVVLNNALNVFTNTVQSLPNTVVVESFLYGKTRDCLPTTRSFIHQPAGGVPAWHKYEYGGNTFLPLSYDEHIDFPLLLGTIYYDITRVNDQTKREMLYQDLIAVLRDIVTDTTITLDDAALRIINAVYAKNTPDLDATSAARGGFSLEEAKEFIAKQYIDLHLGRVRTEEMADSLNARLNEQTSSDDNEPAYLSKFPPEEAFCNVNVQVNLRFSQLLSLACKAIMDTKRLQCEIDVDANREIPTDARNALIVALCEMARGYNFSNPDLDKPEVKDRNICFWGACNKFIENLVGLHTSCEQMVVSREVVDIKYRILLSDNIYKIINETPQLRQRLHASVSEQDYQDLVAYLSNRTDAMLLKRHYDAFNRIYKMGSGAGASNSPLYELVEEVKRDPKLRKLLDERMAMDLSDYFGDMDKRRAGNQTIQEIIHEAKADEMFDEFALSASDVERIYRDIFTVQKVAESSSSMEIETAAPTSSSSSMDVEEATSSSAAPNKKQRTGVEDDGSTEDEMAQHHHALQSTGQRRRMVFSNSRDPENTISSPKSDDNSVSNRKKRGRE